MYQKQKLKIKKIVKFSKNYKNWKIFKNEKSQFLLKISKKKNC